MERYSLLSQISIPEWRRVLQDAIEGKYFSREDYSPWMLREVLEDPEYKETTN